MLSIVAVFGGQPRRVNDRRTGDRRPRDIDDIARADEGCDSPELARQFAQGLHDAVHRLYECYGPAVFTVAHATLGDRQLAAEAVQVTFLKAWRASDRYDPSRRFSSWIYAIARRAAIDVGRRERRHTASEIDEARDTPTASVGIERVWDAWQVRRAIDTLSDDEQQIVRLQHFEQLTHAEIAQHLDLPLGTVKSRSHRAHRRLATALAHLQEEVTG